MTFTPAARALLQRLEACRLTSYPDQGGIWTIGYGHTGPEVVPGLSWPRAHAEEILDFDIARHAAGVSHLLAGVKILNDNEFSALVIFAFNVGVAALAGSSALKHILAGDLAVVPASLSVWNKIHDPQTHQLVVSAGLTKRRQAEIDLWNTPVGYEPPAPVSGAV